MTDEVVKPDPEKCNHEIQKETSDSPVSVLLRIKPDIDFICLNPDKDKFEKYLVQVTVEGDIYKGEGISKRQAKLAVSRMVCEEKYSVVFNKLIEKSISETKIVPDSTSKNPICFLNEYKTLTKFECITSIKNAEGMTFAINCIVDGQSYKGEAKTKKMAKFKSALKACKSIFPNVKFKNTYLLNELNHSSSQLIEESPMILLNNNYPGDFQVVTERVEIEADHADYAKYASQCGLDGDVVAPSSENEGEGEVTSGPKTIVFTECTVVISLTKPDQRFTARHAVPKTARREAARIAISSLTSSGQLAERMRFHVQRRAAGKANAAAGATYGNSRKRGFGCNEPAYGGYKAVQLLKQHCAGTESYEQLGFDVMAGGYRASVSCQGMTFVGCGQDPDIARQQAALTAVRGLNIGGSKQRRQFDGYNGAWAKKGSSNIAQSAVSKNENFWKKGGVIQNDGFSWGHQQEQQQKQSSNIDHSSTQLQDYQGNPNDNNQNGKGYNQINQSFDSGNVQVWQNCSQSSQNFNQQLSGNGDYSLPQQQPNAVTYGHITYGSSLQQLPGSTGYPSQASNNYNYYQ